MNVASFYSFYHFTSYILFTYHYSIVLFCIVIKHIIVLSYCFVLSFTYILFLVLLFCRHPQGVKHFPISVDPDTYYLLDKHFKSMDELVKYYGKHEVPNVERVPNVKLKMPIMYYNPAPEAHGKVYPWNYNDRRDPRHTIPPRANSESSIPTHSLHSIAERKYSESTITSSQLDQVVKLGNKVSGNSGSVGKSSASLLDVNVPTPIRRPPLKIEINTNTRPPQPLPRDAAAIRNHCELLREFFAKAESSGDYAKVRDTEEDQTNVLISQLREHDEIWSNQKCECGIYHRDAQLPGGWTIHRSNEELTRGRLFFMNDTTRETAWLLPTDIYMALQPEEKGKILQYSGGRPFAQHQVRNRMPVAASPTTSGSPATPARTAGFTFQFPDAESGIPC